MKTVPIKKQEAIALLKLMYSQGDHEMDLRNTARDGIPLFVPDGCKVYAKKQGCITRFFLSGYSFSGDDVNRALKRVRPCVL